MELYFKYQRRVQDADVKIERELEVSFTVFLYVQTSPKEKLIHSEYTLMNPPENLRKSLIDLFRRGSKGEHSEGMHSHRKDKMQNYGSFTSKRYKMMKNHVINRKKN